ncbi:MAG TPA: SDR family NAD(P)-dependent oxidoreductase [Sphingobium sp.]|uniref:SDR family NAD(P)-dependent oxidoreductase n=1 Tax=Sphingobium sp. TaxID=1912891 RepID=UPI002ED247CA
MMRFDRHSTAMQVARHANLDGCQIVLTGGSSGIGEETARALALTGAEIVLGVRDVAKGEAVARNISGRIRVAELNLSDLDSVIAFANGITGPVQRLIANAGVSRTPEAHLSNGLDVRFATNHLGHFLLAHRLHPQMVDQGARIVMLSSAAHKGCPVHLDDLQWLAREHSDGMAYAESKSANILFAQEASRRWAADRITANAVLPGSALTGLQRYHGEALKRRIGFIRDDGSVDPMVKSAEQAAATTLWATVAPELEGRGGLVLEDCAEALPVGPDTHAWSGFDARVADPATATALWDHSVELIRTLAGDGALASPS